jgi:uncharacterized protein DUF4154
MSILKVILYQLKKRFTTNYSAPRCIILGLLLISNLTLAAQTPITREFQLKAVFLFNFTQFVEWPASSFSTDRAPLVIGILGKNPFGAYLEEIVSGEKTNGHAITVQYYSDMEEIKTCHILFINMAEEKKVKRIVEGLKGRDILTVGDEPDFSEQGGMIRLFTRENKIKFQVNLEAAKAAGLVLSSKLLRLADIYVPPKNN